MISESGKKIGYHEAADYIPWETMLRVVHTLYKDKDYVMSLFIGVGSFTGLRVSDIRNLTWEQLLSPEPFSIIETKTKKKRTIKMNKDFQQHVKLCYDALHILNPKFKFLISRKKCVYTTQRLNVKLKEIKIKYKMKDVPHISCHSLRKAYGRKVYETAQENGTAEMALVMLSELFNHSSVAITRRYLGLRQEELLSTYDCLTF